MQIALYEPEIPPNTGNIARLCAATDTPLHLIEPLGFSIDDKHLKRAGLDYWPHVRLRVWPDWKSFLNGLADGELGQGARLIPASSNQGVSYDTYDYRTADVLLLGPETRGLPSGVYAHCAQGVRIPIWGQVRSLNLSTAAGILLYEALRRVGGLLEKELR